MSRRLSLVLVCLTFSAACSLGHGQVVSDFEGHTEHANDDVQHQMEWCWAATIHTVLDYYDIKRSQEEIVKMTYGTLVDLPARSPQQLFRTLNNVKFGEDGVEIVKSQFFVGRPNLDWVAQELTDNHPVIMWLNMGGGGGHAIVVYGMEANTGVVDIFDPWPGRGLLKVPRFRLGPMVVCSFSVRGAKITEQKARPPEMKDENGDKPADVNGDFATQLKSLIRACDNDFASVRRGRSEDVEGDRTYKCKIQVEGAKDTEVWIRKDRSSGDDVIATLLWRASDDDAESKLSDYVDKVRGALPGWNESTEEKDDRKAVTFSDPNNSSHSIEIYRRNSSLGWSVNLMVKRSPPEN